MAQSSLALAMDDDDQLTRQRAMDAAAAVAVAAAAAAHQSQEAALQLHHQQHREQQEESHLEEEEEKQSHGDLILNGENDAHRSSSIQIGEEKPDLLNEDEKIGTFADNSMQYVASDYTDQNGDLSRQIDDSQTGAGRPTIHHTKRRKINTCLPCKVRRACCLLDTLLPNFNLAHHFTRGERLNVIEKDHIVVSVKSTIFQLQSVRGVLRLNHQRLSRQHQKVVHLLAYQLLQQLQMQQ